ncbi:molybdate ABC transporter substrate-binding protein [Saccharopolyspora griseoalba]|uniref:Molybdate ABC transporter substrate-binding protein n=1 Tax=Saccharopolyspora griseoalba TaxID=1431848 RepID=A0ABW2LI92_9PSEU
MRLKAIAGAALALVLLAGCGTAGSEQHRTLTVLAAASLTESFDEIGRKFHAEHPEVEVKFDYQGSSTLAEQIRQGRPADVFASADAKNVDKVRDQVSPPRTFATNRLTIAVPRGNPARITSLADLARAQDVVVCAPQVPCGSAAREVAAAGGVRLHPASEENDVKSVLRKVAAGEADAGLVYVTDAVAAGGRVEAVDFPEAEQARNTYPIASINSAPHPERARAFVEFVRGPVGRQVLAEHGFGVP